MLLKALWNGEQGKASSTNSFEPGTQVLDTQVLPIDTSKLTAKWQGPCKVLRKRLHMKLLLLVRGGQNGLYMLT